MLRPIAQTMIVRHQATAAAVTMNNILHETLDSIREAGTFKSERIITTKQAAKIQVAGSNRKILNFCANNYLGLSVSVHYKLIFNFALILVKVEAWGEGVGACGWDKG